MNANLTMGSAPSPIIAINIPSLGDESEAFHSPHVSHPTSMNSMNSGRLSDATLDTGLMSLDHEPDVRTLGSDKAPKRKENTELQGNSKEMRSSGSRRAQLPKDELPQLPQEGIGSAISTPILEENQNPASRVLRSRSNSSGTFSSLASAHVDWDELDKSEEQAPRDECSDEVCSLLINLHSSCC